MVQEALTTCWQTRRFERMLLLQTVQGPNKYWKKSFICFCWQNRWTKSLKSSWTQYLNKVFEDNTKYLKNILEKANLLATSLKQVCERHLWAESLNEIIGTIFEPNLWNKKSLNQVFEKIIEATFEQNVWTNYLNKSLPPTGAGFSWSENRIFETHLWKRSFNIIFKDFIQRLFFNDFVQRSSI